jgi:hypothetical protein
LTWAFWPPPSVSRVNCFSWGNAGAFLVIIIVWNTGLFERCRCCFTGFDNIIAPLPLFIAIINLNGTRPTAMITTESKLLLSSSRFVAATAASCVIHRASSPHPVSAWQCLLLLLPGETRHILIAC